MPVAEEPRAATPEPVQGREHRVVQTDNVIEDLRVKSQKKEKLVQTEAELDFPAPPLPVLQLDRAFRADQSTVIAAGDLFDFDLEVEPVLHTLVTKTLEQGLVEVLEEEEMRDMQEHQEQYLQKRNAELAELQLIVNKDKRHAQERERRMEQENTRVKEDARAALRKMAAAVAKSFYLDLWTNSLEKLRDEGYFYDPTAQQVQRDVLPELEREANARVEETLKAREAVDSAIQSALENTQVERKAAEDFLSKVLQEVGYMEQPHTRPPPEPHPFLLGATSEQVQQKERESAQLEQQALSYSKSKPLAATAAKLLDWQHRVRKYIMQGPDPEDVLAETQQDAERKARDLTISQRMDMLLTCQCAARAYLARRRVRLLRELKQQGYDVTVLSKEDVKPIDPHAGPLETLRKMRAMWGFQVALSADGRPGVIVMKMFAANPGSQATLVLGDRVVSVAGEPVRSPEAFQQSILHRMPGDLVELGVARGLTDRETSLRIELAPSNMFWAPVDIRRLRAAAKLPVASSPLLSKETALEQLKLMRAELDAKVLDVRGGGLVVVKNVLPNSSSERAGLQAEDRVFSLQGAAVGSKNELGNQLQNYMPGDVVELGVKRKENKDSKEEKVLQIQLELTAQLPGPEPSAMSAFYSLEGVRSLRFFASLPFKNTELSVKAPVRRPKMQRSVSSRNESDE